MTISVTTRYIIKVRNEITTPLTTVILYNPSCHFLISNRQAMTLIFSAFTFLVLRGTATWISLPVHVRQSQCLVTLKKNTTKGVSVHQTPVIE